MGTAVYPYADNTIHQVGTENSVLLSINDNGWAIGTADVQPCDPHAGRCHFVDG